jgi:hypothetical protein
MTPEEFARICEWDAKITWPENTMFGTTIDRRRLIEYVRELQTAVRWVKEHGSKHGMPDEVFAVLATIPTAPGKGAVENE